MRNQWQLPDGSVLSHFADRKHIVLTDPDSYSVAIDPDALQGLADGLLEIRRELEMRAMFAALLDVVRKATKEATKP